MDNTSNINSSNIYNLDLELVRKLQELSKKEAPELDDYFHYLNAMKEVMDMKGIKVEKDEYIETLQKNAENETTLLYNNITVEGEEIGGKVENMDILTKEEEKELKDEIYNAEIIN